MTKQQALDRLNLIRVWYEDYGTPDADYDAICYAIGVIEAQPEGLDTLIKALEAEHKKLLEMQKALKNVPDTNVGTTISRQQAIDVLKELTVNGTNKGMISGEDAVHRIEMLPPAQPEPCEDAVSRKDCLKALSNMMDTDGFRNGWAVSRANVECMLKSMPPVTPKQRTGHWIPVGVAELVKAMKGGAE